LFNHIPTSRYSRPPGLLHVPKSLSVDLSLKDRNFPGIFRVLLGSVINGEKAALPPLPKRRFDILVIEEASAIYGTIDELVTIVLKSEMDFLVKYIRWRMDHPIVK